MNYVQKIRDVIQRVEGLGCRTLENGTRLIGHLPSIGPETYLHVTFPPLTSVDIEKIETEMGHLLPDPIRTFYEFANGLFLYRYALSVYGLRRNFVRAGDESWQPYSIITPNKFERPPGAQASTIFFGSYEYDGSMLSISYERPEVYRCIRRTNTVLNTWPSFDEMIVSEIDRLSRLFDDQGRQIDAGSPTTPAPSETMN